MMILLIIVVIVTSQWDKEVQIRKIYDKYLLDIVEGKKRLANENEELQKEKFKLAQQLCRAKNDIKIVEDTYKAKIDELENEISKFNKKRFGKAELELKDILESAEAQNEEKTED